MQFSWSIRRVREPPLTISWPVATGYPGRADDLLSVMYKPEVRQFYLDQCRLAMSYRPAGVDPDSRLVGVFCGTLLFRCCKNTHEQLDILLSGSNERQS